MASAPSRKHHETPPCKYLVAIAWVNYSLLGLGVCVYINMGVYETRGTLWGSLQQRWSYYLGSIFGVPYYRKSPHNGLGTSRVCKNCAVVELVRVCTAPQLTAQIARVCERVRR